MWVRPPLVGGECLLPLLRWGTGDGARGAQPCGGPYGTRPLITRYEHESSQKVILITTSGCASGPSRSGCASTHQHIRRSLFPLASNFHMRFSAMHTATPVRGPFSIPVECAGDELQSEIELDCPIMCDGWRRSLVFAFIGFARGVNQRNQFTEH